MFREEKDLERIATAMERIANSLEIMVKPPMVANGYVIDSDIKPGSVTFIKDIQPPTGR